MGRTGDIKKGETRVLYDPALSTRGVLGVAARKPRPKNPFDLEVLVPFPCRSWRFPLFRNSDGPLPCEITLKQPRNVCPMA